jgi:glycosyltransferase involved in cell wall biosynthesis
MDSRRRKPRLAFWFRYGPAEHAELFYALPRMIVVLSEHFDVYYIGFTSKEKPDAPKEIRKHARVIQIPIKISRRSNAGKTWKTMLWIALIPLIALLSRMAGIRYVYVDETLPLVMPVGRLFFRNRITMTLADFFLEQYLSKGTFKRMLGSFIFRLDCNAWKNTPLLFTRSRSAQEHLSQLGIPREHMHYAYDAMDPLLYHTYNRADCRRKWCWGEKDIVMVYHGVLNPAKDLDTVLNALSDVIKEFDRFRFLIIGNGPDELRLKVKVNEMNLTRHVQFAGYTDPAKVATALGGGDIGLISRKADIGSQLVITSVLGHCLACGIAVIAARTAGISELVTDGENGLLFEPGNKIEFLQKLLRLCRDTSLRKKLADAGLQTAREKLSLEETVTRNTQPLINLWG